MRTGGTFAALAATALIVMGLAAPATTAQEEVDGRYQDFGDQGGVLNILPPGQQGGLNAVELAESQTTGELPEHYDDQLAMYEDLVYNSPGLEEAELLDFFKDASFGVPPDDIGEVYQPHEDVTVIRDESFGVPHIFGETRYATMFAQGYTTAEDRLFLMDVLRHVGRARLSEFVGPSPANIAMDEAQLAVAPYTEEDLTAQIELARTTLPDGEQIFDDGSAYADGVNAFISEALVDPTKLPGEYPALQRLPDEWVLEDTVAIASLVGGIFGKGGGGELINACGIDAMSEEIGDDAATRVFEDFRFLNDAEAPTTSSRPAPYHLAEDVDPAAHPDIDCASLAPIDPGSPSLDDLLGAIAGTVPRPPGPPPVIDLPWGPMAFDLPGQMSNALLVGAEHSADGRPVAVFGPQTAYFTPQLLVEKDVHGPGIDARGVGFAGTDIYVQLGRGGHYAFTATWASADNVDQWILELCEPGGGEATTDSMGYLHDGSCEPITTFDHVQVAVPTAGGVPEDPADIIMSTRIERTSDYGPLVARGRLDDGTPIAVATLRSTYLNELSSTQGFRDVNDPEIMAGGFDAFRRVMADGVDFTFNWFYVDDTDIGYQHSCLCPIRADGVGPSLPTLGDGTYDWEGFLPFERQPFDVNPDSGYLSSWNNKQAPEFGGNDRQFYGPVYRSDALDVRIEAGIASGEPFTRAALVDDMTDAGTVDVRGQEVLPLLLDALGPDAPDGADPRAQELRDRLAGWLETDTHRRDFDPDGAYDDAVAPAILDAWWEPLSRAMFDEPSGGAIDSLQLPLHDAPQLGLGSAFNVGWYGNVDKDLRQILGRPVEDPWSRTYCGDGDLAQCRADLWASLSDTAERLEAEFGSASVDDWRRTVADDAISHTAAGVATVADNHWVNRPTFQQVVQFGAPLPNGEDPPPDGPGPDDPDPDGPGLDPDGPGPDGPGPDGQDPGGQDPGGQDPGGQDPGGQDPGGQDPGGQDPGANLPGEQPAARPVPPGGVLPRTGAAASAALGAVLVAAALGLRRLSRTAESR